MYSLTNATNITRYRVIYGDTDQMGIVYYANYLRWFERGRSEFLRQIGLPYTAIEQQGFNFPVIEVTCRYIQPARYDEVIKIETTLAEIGRARLGFSYRIARESDDALLAEGSTSHACVSRSGRPVRLPKILLDALAAAQQQRVDKPTD
jgi:acyl-CoA thioester hydrolase